MGKRFSDLGDPVRIVIYVANGLLLVGLVVLTVFLLALALFLGILWGALPEAANKGNFIPLALALLILLWIPASFLSFAGVIAFAAWKKRWIWILQFLPFALTGIIYLILYLALPYV